MISDRTRQICIYVVLVVWATNFFAPFFFPEYKPASEIHGIFMAVVGGVMMLRSNKDKDSQKDDDLVK